MQQNILASVHTYTFSTQEFVFLLGLKEVTLLIPRMFQQNREGGGTFQHIKD